jgi:hypothetical protein
VNIDSARTFRGWEAYVTVDPWDDMTAREATLARDGDPRIRIHRNAERQYSMVNLMRGIRRSTARPDDIIVVLDGDDWLATDDALRIVHDTYVRFDCWMTYGSWASDREDGQGAWPAYPEDVSDFRSHTWLGTALRTWKRWLWDLIDDRDFRDASGKYFCVTEDQAVMLPMLEMSGTRRARHIPDVLMIYNRTSPFACAYTCRDQMLANEAYIRTRPPYARLKEKPDAQSARALLRSRRESLLKANGRLPGLSVTSNG